MALWWRSVQEKPIKIIKREDVVYRWNKAARIARRSWYESQRYSKKAVSWGNEKVTNAFVTVFPKSKPAFVEKDLLTGLQDGPSSYFLASLSKTKKKARNALRIKKVEHLSEE